MATKTIFSLTRTDGPDGPVYAQSGEPLLTEDDRFALEMAGKAALGLPSYGQQNRDLIEQIKLCRQRTELLEAALTEAGVEVPA